LLLAKSCPNRKTTFGVGLLHLTADQVRPLRTAVIKVSINGNLTIDGTAIAGISHSTAFNPAPNEQRRRAAYAFSKLS
jgi:hypothetical protein